MTELLHDTGIWVLISFIIFAIVAYRMGKDAFIGMLDGRIEEIRNEINTAESLRIEAQEILAQYERKMRDAEKESQKIIETAKKHVKELRVEAEKELEETMARREKNLQQRLKRMEENAISDIQAHAARLAVQATAEIINEKMDKAVNDRLIDESIDQVSSNL